MSSYFTSTDESDMESQGSDYSYSKRHSKGRKYGQVIDSEQTNAADILNILRNRIAFLSGGVDKRGGPIITFPSQAKTQDISITELTTTILYLAKIPSDESRRHGFTVLIDVRGRTSKLLKPILRSLQACLVGQVYMVCIIRPDSFVERQKANLKIKDKSLSFEIVTMNGTSKLHKYVDHDQLTADLNGIMNYDHDTWVDVRVALEKFRKHAIILSQHFDQIEMQLEKREIANDVPGLEYLIQQHRNFRSEVFDAPLVTLREGQEVLAYLRPKLPPENGHLEHANQSFTMTPDQVNMLKEATLLSEQLKARYDRLKENWHSWNDTLSNYLALAKFDEGFKEVMAWVKNSAEPYLSSSNDIGNSYSAIQTIKAQHDRFELVAREMIKTYQDLLDRASDLLKEGHYASAEIQSKAEHMKFACITIQSNLERRRNLIDASMNFHQEAVDLSHCLDEQFKLAAAYADEDDLQGVQEMMRVLQEKSDTISRHFDGVHSQAKNIMKLLYEPVVSSSGENITTDTREQQWYITQRIATLEDKKARCNEILDVQKSKLKQYQQLWGYRQDTDETISWLQELCAKLRSSVDMGKSTKKSQELQIENEKFEDNAKDSYEYAMQTLNTAISVRNTGEYEEGPTKQQQDALGEIWNKFTAGVKERASRLTVAIMVHHKIDQILGKIYTVTNKLKNANERATKNYTINHLNRRRQVIESTNSDCNNTLNIGKVLIDRIQQPVIRGGKVTTQERKDMKKSMRKIEARLLELQNAKQNLNETWRNYHDNYGGLDKYIRYEDRATKHVQWINEKGGQIRNKIVIAENSDQAKVICNLMQDYGKEIKAKDITVEKIIRIGEQNLKIFQEQSEQYNGLIKSLQDSWNNLKAVSLNWSSVVQSVVGFYEFVDKLGKVIDEAERKKSVSTNETSSGLTRQLNSFDELLEKSKKYINDVNASGEEILNLIRNLQQQMQISGSPIRQALDVAKEKYADVVKKRNDIQKSLQETELSKVLRSDIKQLQLFIDGTVRTVLARNIDFGRKLGRLQQFEKAHLNIRTEIENNEEKYQKIEQSISYSKLERGLDLSSMDAEIDKLMTTWPEYHQYVESRMELTNFATKFQNRASEVMSKCNDLISQSRKNSQSKQDIENPEAFNDIIDNGMSALKNEKTVVQSFLSEATFDSHLDAGSIMEGFEQILADLEERTGKAKGILDSKDKAQKSSKLKDDLTKALKAIKEINSEIGKVSLGESSSSVDQLQEKLKEQKFKLAELKRQVNKITANCADVSAQDINRLLDSVKEGVDVLTKNLSAYDSLLQLAAEFFKYAEEYDQLLDKSKQFISSKPDTSDVQQTRSIIAKNEAEYGKLASSYVKVSDTHERLCEAVNQYQEQPNALDLTADGIQQIAEDFALQQEEIAQEWSNYQKELEKSLEVSALNQVIDKTYGNIEAHQQNILQKQKASISTLLACKRAKDEFDKFQLDLKETADHVLRLTEMATELDESENENANEVRVKAEDLEERWLELTKAAEKYNFTLKVLYQFFEYCSEGEKWIRDFKKMMDDFGDKIPKRPSKLEASRMSKELTDKMDSDEMDVLFSDVVILAKHLDLKASNEKVSAISKKLKEAKRDAGNLKQQLELLKEGKIRGLWKLTSTTTGKTGDVENEETKPDEEQGMKRSPSDTIKALLDSDPTMKSNDDKERRLSKKISTSQIEQLDIIPEEGSADRVNNNLSRKVSDNDKTGSKRFPSTGQSPNGETTKEKKSLSSQSLLNNGSPKNALAESSKFRARPKSPSDNSSIKELQQKFLKKADAKSDSNKLHTDIPTREPVTKIEAKDYSRAFTNKHSLPSGNRKFSAPVVNTNKNSLTTGSKPFSISPAESMPDSPRRKSPTITTGRRFSAADPPSSKSSIPITAPNSKRQANTNAGRNTANGDLPTRPTLNGRIRKDTDGKSVTSGTSTTISSPRSSTSIDMKSGASKRHSIAGHAISPAGVTPTRKSSSSSINMKRSPSTSTSQSPLTPTSPGKASFASLNQSKRPLSVTSRSRITTNN